jgi:hypothetical protein
MEMEEIVKFLVVVIILILMVGFVIVVLKGKGGDLLGGLKNLMRLGR